MRLKSLTKHLSIKLAIAFLVALIATALTIVFAGNAYAGLEIPKIGETTLEEPTLKPTVENTTTEKITAYLSGDGSLVVPDTEFANTTKHTVTIENVTSPDTYSFTKDWTCDAIGKTLSAGESLSIKWTAPSRASADVAQQVIDSESLYVGDITYSYSYFVPDLSGSVSIEGTKKVFDTLTAQVSDAPEDAQLSYVWYRGDTPGATTKKVGSSASYSVGLYDDAHYLTCVVSDTSGLYGKTLFATCYIDDPQAFAVYSADDTSLSFYKRSAIPSWGSTFNGKTVTALYPRIEERVYLAPDVLPWKSYLSSITKVVVEDYGIKPVSTSNWFCRGENIVSIDLAKLDTSNTTNMSSMFQNCYALTSVDVSHFDTSKVTDMNKLFANDKLLVSVGDLSNWDTRNVTSMLGMFWLCEVLTSADFVSSWSTSNVTRMYGMFYGCKSLTSLDLSNFDTSNVTDMKWMFFRDYALTTIGDVSKWNTKKVTDMYGMFYFCSKISVDCSSWDVSQVENHEEFKNYATNVIEPNWVDEST